VIERLVEYTHGDALLEGYLAISDTQQGPRPGVVIAHAWGGRSGLEEETARRLAELGYAGFALDMYGKGVRGQSRDENAALIAPFLENRSMLQERISCSVSALQLISEVDSSRIAAVGYCFGGLCVLDLARSGAAIRGVVSVHGLFAPPEPQQPLSIKAKVLALHGHEDPMVPVEAVNRLEQELTDAGADWQIHVYGGTMHAFTNPNANDPEFGTVYNERAARRAWASTTDFLAEVLA
jgi:dienelactone hydrolase